MGQTPVPALFQSNHKGVARRGRPPCLPKDRATTGGCPYGRHTGWDYRTTLRSPCLGMVFSLIKKRPDDMVVSIASLEFPRGERECRVLALPRH